MPSAEFHVRLRAGYTYQSLTWELQPVALLFLVLAVGNRNLPLSTASVSMLALFRLLWHYLYLEIRPGEAVVRNGFAVHRFCLDDVSPRCGVPDHSSPSAE